MLQLSHLLLMTLMLSSIVLASPSADDELRAFFARESASVKPLHLGRRSAATTPTRHLRPSFDGASESNDVARVQKRDTITPPDVGQVADFGGQDPQPIRNGNGDTYLSNANHEIDAQNPDNLAGPPTDSGEAQDRSSYKARTAILLISLRDRAEFEVEHVPVAHTSLEGMHLQIRL